MQDQGLDIRRQPVVDRREHRVVALAGVLDDGVAGIVDEVDVVAGAADHEVGAGAAVENIVAGVAEDRVAQAVAVALQSALPCRIRASTFADSVDRRREHLSLPSPAFSTTASPALSTK